ncbi:MAG: ATP-binding cassette domain-containing protein, partial [Actinobacteria bacterium]|nr:ATP-binding cassette domain-containing protein [Actinomycetota bacterium]
MARRHIAGAGARSRRVRGAVRDRGPGLPGRGRWGAAAAIPEGRCGVTSVELRGASRWYGSVVAVNDVTMTIGPGVTGLLGPNGAGKSTLIHLISGFLAPSRGEVTVSGERPWRNPDLFRRLGLVPERDSVYAF